ncbi:hypothetical protein Bdiaspc4_39855 [Bradyrhizobium diazoefficiens]|nr:hypothetical protein Bdiaspc4_39855 [Bradyrhizobium diazoefficiens]
MLQSKAGYIDARPHHLIDEPLATHGRTIHSGHLRPTWVIRSMSDLSPIATERRTRPDHAGGSRAARDRRARHHSRARALKSDQPAKACHSQSLHKPKPEASLDMRQSVGAQSG